MPANRPPKSRTKPTAKAVPTDPPSGHLRAVFQIGYLVPGWEVLPPAAPEGSPERRLWLFFGRKIKVIAQGGADVAPGVLLLDIETPYGPDESEPMPAEYAAELVDRLRRALPGILRPGGVEPSLLPPSHFPDFGEVRITAHYLLSFPETVTDKEVARHFVSPHNPHSKPYIKTDSIVTEAAAHPPQPAAQTPAAALRSLAATLPVEYERRAPALAGENHMFRQQLATELAPALNARIRAMPQGTLEQKKAICDFITSELEPLGLAVKCPNTGLPAKLKASTGHWPGIGRFHFEVYIDGKRKMPAYSDTLPGLELIDATPPPKGRETAPPSGGGEGGWQAAIGPKTGRIGGKRS